MGLGLQPDGSGIGTQMGPRFQHRWAQDCKPRGSGIATPSAAAQLGLDLQSRWMWDCKPGGFGVTTQKHSGLQTEGSRTGMQMELGLRPILFWDWNPNRSGLATEIRLELEPK